MAPQDPAVRRTTAPERQVRPRWVWAGTLLAIAGVILLGVGLMAQSLSMSTIGVVVLVLGGAMAWRAGVLRDTHTADPGAREEESVQHGGTRAGTVAGDMVHLPAAQAESRAADRRRREVLERSHRTPAPAPARGAAVIMLIVAAVLLCAQWALYPPGAVAQANALRASAMTVLLILCALRIITADEPRRVPACLAIVAGLVLALFGPLAPHQETAVAWTETALGTVVVLAGVAALMRGPGGKPTADGAGSAAAEGEVTQCCESAEKQ